MGGAEHAIEKDILSSERVWYENQKTFLLILLVLATSLSLPYFRVLNNALPDTHPVVVAGAAGMIITALVYLPMHYINSKYGLSSAVLLGILVAEFCVFGAPCNFPAPIVIAFFFFIFYHGYDEREHSWPANHMCAATHEE